jgi:tRNA(Ile)-lysidine synthase
LLAEYNPRVREALLRTARIAGDDAAALDEVADDAWQKIVSVINDTVVFDKEALLAIPPATQRYLFRRGIARLLGNLQDIEACHIEDIVIALSKPAGKTIQLPYGLVFTIEYDRFLLGSNPAALSPFPPLSGDFPLSIPGETPVGDWTVVADFVSRAQVKPDDGFTAFLNFAKTGRKLSVRTYRPGDRFQPLGMDRPKKLARFMMDSRIPHAWRDRVPVVFSPEQIVWVAGYRIDDRVKVTGGTERILRLVFRRNG